jgi:hypothetical protein
MNFDRKKAQAAIDRMQDTPPKTLYGEVMAAISWFDAEGLDHRSKRLGDALWAIIQHADVNINCEYSWYGSEPCRRPQAQDDAHVCGERLNHGALCRCQCGEACFK